MLAAAAPCYPMALTQQRGRHASCRFAAGGIRATLAAAAAAARPPLPAPLLRRRRLTSIAPAAAAAAAAASQPDDHPQQQDPQQRQQQPASSIQGEILALALPTLATLAADPLAALVSTAFISRVLGAGPLAAAGVALSAFSSTTKLLNVPLLAITTSSVATAVGQAQQQQQLQQQGEQQQQQGKHAEDAVSTAVSAALLLATIAGVAQAAVLGFLGPRFLAAWGAGPSSPLFADAAAFLSIRAAAAPATVLMMVLQGCFRGLGDTHTPFYGTLLANLLTIALEAALLLGLSWGVRGAALAVGMSQAVACVALLMRLQRRCPLQLVGGAALKSSAGYLKSTGLLALRTLAVMGAYALATSLVARTDAAHAAAHQIAFQVWLASSLLADSLAVAAQSLLARDLAAGQQAAGRAVVKRTQQLALALGCAIAAALALGGRGIAAVFASDPSVLRALALVWPAVIATQPLNALAFLADGILYGVGGFAHAASAMVAACIPAAGAMLLGSRLSAGLAAGAALDAQLISVWVGLGTLMLLRWMTIYIPLVRRDPPFDQLGA